MANTITGRIFELGMTQAIPTKTGSTITRREVILDCTRFDPYTGEKQFENFPAFEFSGEKCNELDAYKVGDIVTVSFDLTGSFYESNGVRKNFTRIRGYKVERLEKRNREQQQFSHPYQTTTEPVVTNNQSQAPQAPVQGVLGAANDLPW